MSKRLRSPNYPNMSLREAIHKTELLYAQIGQNPTSRDVVARGMGYSGLSGASAKSISSLKKYGLLDGRGEDIQVSQRAMAILYPHSEGEKSRALREAAFEPGLFRELAEKFTSLNIGDDLLKNYLLRNKFAPHAVDSAISSYRETMEFVGGLGDHDDEIAPGPVSGVPEKVQFTEKHGVGKASGAGEAEAWAQTLPPGPIQPRPSSDEMVEIGSMGFPGVGFVKIVASSNLSPGKALSMAQQVISSLRAALQPDDPKNADTEDESYPHGDQN